jgi:DNA-binding CsgD family transcriptional regulator
MVTAEIVDSPPPRPASTPDLVKLAVRLAELGPPSELRRKGTPLVAEALGFDRVLLSSIADGVLQPEALHDRARRNTDEILSRLREDDVRLEYPLVEGEIVRRRRAQLIRSANGAAPHAFADSLEWGDYVVAPIVLDGRVMGLFHADRRGRPRGVDESDAIALGSCAIYFALVYERAALRQRLHEQRQEMRRIASWADARTSELGDRSITLTADAPASAPYAPVRASGIGEDALRDLLTPRELDVLRLMVGGVTNAAIAKDLVVAEGTVKFHVKNILRKLHAANRAEATSRYLRLTLRRDTGGTSA